MTDRTPIIVFGYHDVGAACLELLVERGESILAVFTHEEDPNEEVWFRSVAAIARKAGLPVYTPTNPNTPEWLARIRALGPALIFSFYYRHMLSPELLALAPLGAFNMHGSLLPRYRGRAPINWAILHGETQTGVSLHVMTRRADAGDIIDQEPVPIGARDTARIVFDRVTQAARIVLARNLAALKQGTAPRRAQDEAQASYFGGRKPEDGQILWSLSATRIFDLIRAVTHPYPGAFTLAQGRRLFVWWAEPRTGDGQPGEILSLKPLLVAAGAGAVEATRVQWEGGVETPGEACRGLACGQILGV